MTEVLLSVRDLRVEYLTEAGPVTAVDGVSFDIARGQVVGLAGESGSGKSTIAQAILRTLRPPGVISGGQVHFAGRDVLAMSDDELRRFRWKHVAMVFQSAMNVLNPVLTIGEQLTDVMHAHERVSPAAARDRAASLLGRVGISSSFSSSYPHQLSGGMRQRVAIAMAMALEPELLIMDEPTTALDVVVQREILQQIGELRGEQGFSILFITHDLSLLFQFSDVLGICYAGRLCELGTSAALLSQPQHPYTRGLLDSFPTLLGPRRVLRGIAGAPPNLAELPRGCRFAPRCERRIERCERLEPRLSDGPQRVACHVPLSLTPAQDTPHLEQAPRDDAAHAGDAAVEHVTDGGRS